MKKFILVCLLLLLLLPFNLQAATPPGGTMLVQSLADCPSNKVCVDNTGAMRLPNGTDLPVSCNAGEIHIDTDATSGQQIYVCEAGTFTLQGDGGSGDDPGWLYTALAAEPASPLAGKVYRADNEAAGWDPATYTGTDDYFVLYTGAAYVPIMDINGNLIQSGIASSTPTISDPDTWTITAPYGAFYIASAAGSVSLPVIAEGMNLVVSVRGAVVAVVDPNGTEEIFLNGVSCTAGVSIQSEGDNDGESVVLRYSAAGDWDANAYGWICTP